jgi:Zn-dependent protease
MLSTISYMGLPLLLAMVLHEYAHGWVANRYGDPTARLEGRLTLNPLAHVDLVGTLVVPMLCLILPGSVFLGWARPVPVNPAWLRRPRRDMALVAAAGPAMNLLMAMASGLVLSGLLAVDPTLMASWPPQPGQVPRRDLMGMLMLPLVAMALYSVFINVLFMAFNLIPIPPLDGGRILASLLPAQHARVLRQLEPYGMFLIVALIVFDPQIRVIHTITGTVVNLIASTILVTTGALE